jgi:integrase/recombinase XerD
MFESLFQYPGVAARHREGPSVEARERFLNHGFSQGLARATLLRQARELLVIAERVDLAGGDAIGLPTIEAAANRWAREQHKRQRARSLQWPRQLFIQTATKWMQFLGRFDEHKSNNIPFADRLAEFAAYGREERGLSPATIRNQSWHVEKFLAWLGKQNRSFHDISLVDVDAFLAENGKQRWGRVSVANSAQSLRAFFRYAAVRGWCADTVAAGIDGPCLFQYEGLPVGPSWPEVQQLIASTSGDAARDIRDRAILMLLATYGFRSGEVVGLRLEDVNWDRETISITRPKQRRAEEYPLTHDTGEAILRYLQQVRPRCDRREIFLTLRAPFRSLSAGGLYHVVSARLDVLGIRVPHRGPHSLRHACAGHLVSEGFSLKEIGDHLGHRSAYATRIYAKVDLAGLREVANFDMGGLQ